MSKCKTKLKVISNEKDVDITIKKRQKNILNLVPKYRNEKRHKLIKKLTKKYQSKISLISKKEKLTLNTKGVLTEITLKFTTRDKNNEVKNLNKITRT